MPKLSKIDDELTLSLSGAQDFNAALDAARSIYPRRFDPDSKLWVYPAEADIAEKILHAVHPDADEVILGWVRAARAERDKALTTKLPDDADNLLVPWANELFPFQRAFVDFSTGHPRVILADDMGLGKTVQSLSAGEEYVRRTDVDPSNPRFIICPNSAKGVWAREINRWLGKKAPYVIIDGTPKQRKDLLKGGVEDGAWIIMNYEQIRAQKHVEPKTVKHRDGTITETEQVTWTLKESELATADPLLIIADEAHRAKNRKTATARGLWMLQAPMMIAATGTPLMNNPAELWSLLRWLYPEQYGRSTPGHPRTPYWTFFDEYVDAHDAHGRAGKVIIGVKNPDRLRFELKNRLVRRTKAEKLNLPEKTREYIPLEMGKIQAKAYAQVEEAFWAEIDQAIHEGDKSAEKFLSDVVEGKKRIYEIPNGAARLVRQRQVLCSPALLGGEDSSCKLDAIQEFILDNSHQQHVVFTEFIMGANLLVERLRKGGVEAEAFTGEVSDPAIRTRYEDEFQRGDIDVLVGTLGAMRESITLHAANIVHFCERAWVPGWNEQAEDRLHRAGQLNPVTILIYEVESTVDTDKVKPANKLKEMIVSRVIKKDEIAEVA